MKTLEQVGSLLETSFSVLNGIRKSETTKKIKSDIKDSAVKFKDLVVESETAKKVSEGWDSLMDMLPFPVVRELTNYKYWLINQGILIKFTFSVPPGKLIEAFLKYQWMIDYTKGAAMSDRYQKGRTGANFFAMHEELTYVIRVNAQCLADVLNNPERTILLQNVVATEIITAMGLYFHPAELGSTLGKLDQWAVLPYLESAEAAGLSVDTCGLPKSTLGMSLLKDFPECCAILGCNYPCDGGMSTFSYTSETYNLPVYRLNMPYDLRNDNYVDTFVEDLKGMIEFLEENTPGKMDWDRLRHICEGYNEMVEAEYERWEMLKLDNPPFTNDCFQQTHYYNFSYLSSLDLTVNHHKKLLEMNRKALKKGQPSFDNMRYRCVVWNPPPSAWGHWYGWIEQCWGVGVVFDIESSGTMWPIDTSTPETMLQGLAKRYMWQIMAKHTKGPVSNYLDDFFQAVEDYRPDFVLYPYPVGCKNVVTMEGVMRAECKKRDLPICVYKMELQDNRVSSRQQMREDISKFMQDVMQAEPLDPSLLKVDDSDFGRW